MRIKVRLFILLFFSFLVSNVVKCQVIKSITLSDNISIWDKAPHNAFTTLESFDGYLYCAFREATNHKSYDGKIRIIRSKDTQKWESVALISIGNEDLRDPKLIVNNGKIILLIVSRTKSKHYSYTYSSFDGMKWSLLEKANDTWRWSATLWDNFIYSVGYSGNDRSGQIYKSGDGKKWTSVKRGLFPNVNNLPNETKLFITPNNKMVALVRQERGNQNAIIGIAEAPYSDWTWRDLGIRMGSPSGIVLNENEILACVRLYNHPVCLSLVKINITDASYKEIATLPSGGDTGYADIVKFNNQYYISYYSSKNRLKKAVIYLTKLNISQDE